MHCMVDMMDLNSERKLPAVQGVSTCGIRLSFTKAKGTHHFKVVRLAMFYKLVY